MGTHQNVIELNGKVYDASTGRTVGSPAHPVKGAVVDGFIRKPKTVSHTPKPAAPKKTTNHHQAPHAHHHKAQRANTLMRGVVSKPNLAIENPAEEVRSESPVLPSKSTDPARLRRAHEVHKSSLISKFGFSNRLSPVTKKVEPLGIKTPPKDHKQTHSNPESAHNASTRAPISAAQAHFNRALSHAKAHEQPAHVPKKPRKKLAHRIGISQKTFNAGASVLAAILLIGFFAYQNVPNISMRIAASRAGFSAKLPSYKPAGFSFGGPIEYAPGQITVNFASNSDERNFHLTQKVSSWNSQALLDNYLLANHKAYQTYQDKGRTIYIYDGSNATWVSGGVWYQIEGNSSLNNDQLLQIANSI